MLGVGKTLPTGKKILDNIYLSFYYGAKIGVLGLNGAGKSTLLRIIAGQDANHDGTIESQPGLTIGMLEQEPDLGGDDRYIGNRAGSLGGALAGVGLLVDRHGDDTYAGDVLTQGAAFCGVGVLSLIHI